MFRKVAFIIAILTLLVGCGENRTYVLENVTVIEKRGSSGFYSVVVKTSDGNEYNFDISRSDYAMINEDSAVNVTFTEHGKRGKLTPVEAKLMTKE